MNTYQLSEKLTESWTWGLLAAAAIYVASGRWRDYPAAEGRTAEQVAAESRRRTRLMRRSLLTVVALWFVVDTVISGIWALHHG